MSGESGRPSSEFLSEAQEVVESFSRSLLELDAQQRRGDYDPDLLNAAFRAIHSLKGLSSLFGASAISELSHALESTLDGLRLGKLPLSPAALDLLFESVEAFQRMLATIGHGETPPRSTLLARIDALASETVEDDSSLPLEGLDDSILGVLTEYEEHRLRENLRLGRRLFRVHASFDLLAIDKGIETLKSKMKAFGEVITYLPSADASSEDRIDLDILIGSDASLTQIVEGMDGEAGTSVTEITLSRRSPEPAAAAAPARAADPVAAKAVEARPTAPVPESPTEPAVEPAPGDLTLRSVSQTVRVELSRLDHLMNLIGELGVVQANLESTLDVLRAQAGTADVARELRGHLRSMDRKLSLLQQGILDVRMVPLGQVFDKLARVVRKLGREAEKEIRLQISGSDTELDKLIVEELSDPLMHMIRNCIDHGIEPPLERKNLGKPMAGRIDLRAFQKGNRVVIEVEDDGRGMDWREIRQAAVRKGLVADAASRELGMPEVVDFIFAPGFTTRDSATEVSGRGVGMDVVKTNISRLSGMIDVDTTLGRGTKFSITLPVTLAIIQALVIQTAGRTYCIPLNSVLESIMVQHREITTVEGHEVISLRGKTLPLLYLDRIFDLDHQGATRDLDRLYVVIVGLAQHRIGLVVDELLGQQDVVIKPLGHALRAVPGIAGATEIAGGRTVLLLDVSTLVEEVVTRPEKTPTPAPRKELVFRGR